MRREPSCQRPDPSETAATERQSVQGLSRREEQYALLDKHRQLTAQLQALNERFHSLELELLVASQDRRLRLLAILEDEMEVLHQARELDADIRRLFVAGPLTAGETAAPYAISPD